MAIHCYSGLPGKGKTAESTYFAVKHYKLINGRINRLVSNILNIKESLYLYVDCNSDRKNRLHILHLVKYIISDFRRHNRWFKLYPNNNVFSNYPILLDPLNKFKQNVKFAFNTMFMYHAYNIIEVKNIHHAWHNVKHFMHILESYKWLIQYSKFDKYKIYSNVIQLADLNMIYKFPKHSFLIFDEAQRYQDSRDFASFPKALGTFLQHHRHATIDDIIYVTQHPRRLDNKIRDLCEVFRKYRMFIKLPFIPYVFASYTNYYEFEDYGKFNQLPKEARTYDYDNHLQILPTSKTFDRYKSKYFSVIFEDLDDVPLSQFTGLGLTKTDIEKVGIKL